MWTRAPNFLIIFIALQVLYVKSFGFEARSDPQDLKFIHRLVRLYYRLKPYMWWNWACQKIIQNIWENNKNFILNILKIIFIKYDLFRLYWTTPNLYPIKLIHSNILYFLSTEKLVWFEYRSNLPTRPTQIHQTTQSIGYTQ